MGKQRACKCFLTPVTKVDTPQGTVCRGANANDLSALYHLDQICFGPLAWPFDAWTEVVAEPDWMTTVLCQGEKIVGSSVILPLLPQVHLASIGVAPEFRRRGLGKLLLLQALHYARGWRAQWLTLEVDLDNLIARRFYQTQGFGVVRRFREDGRHRVEMHRRLARAVRSKRPLLHLL